MDMKFRCYLLPLGLVIILIGSLSSRGFGQDLEPLQQFVQSSTSSEAASKLLREGRELIGERKWDPAAVKFNEIIRNYQRDKNLDAALYWLAFCMKQQGRPQEADETLERLVKDFPRSKWRDDARALRIELAGALGKVDVAKAALENLSWASASSSGSASSSATASPSGSASSSASASSSQRRDKRQTAPEDANESIKLVALQSLFQIDPESAMSAAVGFLKPDSKASPTVQEAAIGLIARHGGEKAWPVLMDTARNQSIALNVREQAIYWIAQPNRPQKFEMLIQLYDAELGDELKERILNRLADSNNDLARGKVVEIARSDKSPE